MAGFHRLTGYFGGREHGQRFTTDKWNDTVINGNEFTLRWNVTVDPRKGFLGLFKITYPNEGVVVYEEVKNITGEPQFNLRLFKTRRTGLL